MMRAATIIMLLLVGAGCGLLGSEAENMPLRGKIVFSALDTTGIVNYQLFTIRPDGSDLRQLTFFESSGAYYPAWSPDGQTIAFASDSMGTTAGAALWLMDADGGNLRPVFRYSDRPWALLGSHPAWSPDGTRLAYDHCINCEMGGRNHEIFMVELATDSVTRLTEHPVGDTYPAWSPSGQQLSFVSGRDYFKADSLRFRKDIYIIDTKGISIQRLTKTGYARTHKWNPKENTIIFRSSGSSAGLFQINVQSEAILKIKEGSYGKTLFYPNAWSLDGTRLLVTERNINNHPRTNLLYILDLENNKMRKIYSKSSDDAYPILMGADWHTLKKN